MSRPLSRSASQKTSVKCSLSRRHDLCRGVPHPRLPPRERCGSAAACCGLCCGSYLHFIPHLPGLLPLLRVGPPDHTPVRRFGEGAVTRFLAFVLGRSGSWVIPYRFNRNSRIKSRKCTNLHPTPPIPQRSPAKVSFLNIKPRWIDSQG
jgi:hypothetical protein